MSTREVYKKIIFDLILEYKIKVKNWRSTNSGYAYYDSWEIEIPKPISLSKFMTCAHEIGHLVKDKSTNPMWYQEYLATKYAIDTCHKHNIVIPKKEMRNNTNYLIYSIAYDIRENKIDINKISFTHFFLQDEKSMELLKTIGYTNTTFAGDTRFDRVADIAANVKSFPLIEQFKQDKNVFICGSTWAEDEKIICHYFSGRHPELVEGQQQKENNYKLIIAPHEIDENHIKSILELFKSVTIVRYSQANEANVKTTDVLIIDNIGMLSSLYQYGTIAYIGGGFGKGIHNILEAATFGLPTIFGPNYLKFNEAKELINAGGSFSIANYAEFEKTMQLLNDKSVLKTASNQSKQYVQSRVGATSKILNSIDWKS